MNTLTKKKLFTMVLSIVLVLAAFGAAIASFAWYTTSENLDESKMIMQADSVATFEVSDAQFLSPNDILRASIANANNQNQDTTNTQSIDATNGVQSNEFARLNIDFELYNASGDFKFSVSAIEFYLAGAVKGDTSPVAVAWNDGNMHLTVFDASYTYENWLAGDLGFTDIYGTFGLYNNLTQDLSFRFYDDIAVGPAEEEGVSLNSPTGKPTSDVFTLSDSGTVYIAVNFNITDDLVDPAYNGLQIKVKVDMMQTIK